MFVAGGQGDYSDPENVFSLAYSLDGEEWVGVENSSALFEQVLCVADDGDMFVAGGNDEECSGLQGNTLA